MVSDPLRGARGGIDPDASPRRRAAVRGTSDVRAARARELHEKAAEADRTAARYREERDRLLLQLRADDPQRWSYTALAAAVGCSRELVALVLRRSRSLRTFAVLRSGMPRGGAGVGCPAVGVGRALSQPRKQGRAELGRHRVTRNEHRLPVVGAP